MEKWSRVGKGGLLAEARFPSTGQAPVESLPRTVYLRRSTDGLKVTYVGPDTDTVGHSVRKMQVLRLRDRVECVSCGARASKLVDDSYPRRYIFAFCYKKKKFNSKYSTVPV